jgi:RHS repeat-associated protein
MTDHGGRTWTYRYNTRGRLSGARTPWKLSMRYRYDTAGKLAEVKVGTVSMANIEYDAKGRVAGFTGSGVRGRRFHYAEEKGLRRTLVTNGLGAKSTMTYRSLEKGSLTELKDPLGDTLTVTYNERELPIRFEAKTGITEFEYDENWNLAEVKTPSDEKCEFSYDSAGNLVLLRDPVGREYRFEYDKRQNVTKIIFPSKATMGLTYNARGQLVGYTDRAGVKTAFAYDEKGDLSKITDASGRTFALVYDMLHRLKEVQRPGGDSLKLRYDKADNITSMRDTLGNTVRFRHDSCGNLTELVDPRGRSTKYFYDALGQLVARKDAAGSSTWFSYDSEGNLMALTDPAGNTTRFRYDALGRQTEEIDPRSKSRKFVYNRMSLLEKEIGPDGGTTRYEYNHKGDLTRINYPDETFAQFRYDKLGNISEIKDPENWLRYSYNMDDQVTRVEDKILKKTLEYAYNKRGNRSAMVGPTGTTRYEYDKLGRPAKIVDASGRTFAFRYNETGLLKGLTYPNGVKTEYTHDKGGRLLTLVTCDKDGSEIDRFSYAYDANGNRISCADKDGNKTEYSYDDLDRLVAVKYPDGRTETFRYDSMGNRLARGIKGSGKEKGSSTEFVYGPDNRLEMTKQGDVRFRYDASGNLVKKETPKGTFTYRFDDRDRLLEVKRPDGKLVRYGYAPNGLRTWKEVDGKKTRYLYDFEDVVAEFSEKGEMEVSYLHGLTTDTPLSMTQATQSGEPGHKTGGPTAGKTYFYHADGQLSITALTDTAGKVAARYRYDAFGNPLMAKGNVMNPYRYTGRRWDKATGLYYYRLRYYDAGMGRFLSKDPAGLWGGLNGYAYVDNNPVNAVDPQGAWVQILIGAGIGALVDGGIELGMQLIENGGDFKKVSWKKVAIEAGKGAVIGAACTVGVGLIAKAAKGGKVAARAARHAGKVKKVGKVGRFFGKFKTPLSKVGRFFGKVGRKAKGLVTKKRMLGLLKAPFKYAWNFAKAMPKKVLDGAVYGITNAVLGVLIYNKITAGTFNILKTIKGSGGEKDPGVEDLLAKSANDRMIRDNANGRIGMINGTISVINNFKTRRVALENRLLLLENMNRDGSRDADIAKTKAEIAAIDETIKKYLDHMAWYYHNYDEMKGIMDRRMAEMGMKVDKINEIGRPVSGDHAGYRVSYGENYGTYIIGERWPREGALAPVGGGEASGPGISETLRRIGEDGDQNKPENEGDNR